MNLQPDSTHSALVNKQSAGVDEHECAGLIWVEVGIVVDTTSGVISFLGAVLHQTAAFQEHCKNKTLGPEHV